MSKDLVTLISAKDLYEWCTLSKRDFVIIDLRVDDFNKGHIKGAWNFPTIGQFKDEDLIRLATQLDSISKNFDCTHRTKVIFHCSSSRGRGPRVALQFKNYCDQNGCQDKYESCVLVLGFNGWISLCEKENNFDLISNTS
ncbi:hypothetical protein NCAS_0A03040 [Naumovozyma castellii]|uniref:Rhodanese domain-containing protein n=1 Tax=Naumovozyma castellii TaxID=27288 RepID=G0V5X4_NAUCA|nr:hypothetical protein NCAS_0A03040 [Naumovozyma castellii CBS 4309]CCC66862.1 hypothetical protein NCAS_0A03040 [Naumovozyma castellii CBS 4309]